MPVDMMFAFYIAALQALWDMCKYPLKVAVLLYAARHVVDVIEVRANEVLNQPERRAQVGNCERHQ